ncbi:MAG: SprT family zinc-dependent metalloprotease [Gammaproteobacteria bacterium]|nr:SprT family zinc-dependent metalloprotease [Gammaproteobacteria bacterium]
MSKLLVTDTTKYFKQTLQYGEERIPYQVFFIPGSKRKIKVDILPTGTVHVFAPETADFALIKAAVNKRARWIYNHLRKIQQRHNHVLPREYVSGESHYYLGRRYVLKVFKVKNIEPNVKLFRGQLQVRVKSRNPEAIKSLLNGWYREHAEQVFARRIDDLVAKISWLKTTPTWKMRVMKKQWGSCSAKGVLTLNPLLVKAPRDCIDYVIVHEICHIKEHNHSPKYYKLLKRLLPNWEETKSRLDGMSEYLLVE